MTTHREESDHRFPTREDSVLPELLARRAAEQPERMFVVYPDGSSWTYRETYEVACRAATALRAAGVEQDDVVLSWLPNGSEALRVWFGLSLLGAIYVPINLAYRGRLLEHVIENSEARLLVGHGELLPRLEGLNLGRLDTVMVVGTSASTPPGLRAVSGDTLLTSDDTPVSVQRPIEPWDVYSIIYTSGTTGPSKGVLSTYMHLYDGVVWAYKGIGVSGDDTYLLQMPLFHHGGIIGTYAMIALGGSIAMVPSFDTASFWSIIKRNAITVCALIGSMATFLAKQEPSKADVANPLRLVIMVPLMGDVTAFAERFDVTVFTMFGSTETSCPLISGPNPAVSGTCGRVRPGMEVRLVDDADREVAPGETGQLMVRGESPWSLAHSYHRMAEATAAAWRNGWFHTGDAFRRDAEGNFFFVDRVKDYIRRRGENISSFELEAEILAHPHVREAAAVGVASEFGEDEVLAVVAPREGCAVDPEELIRFLVPRLPHFMVPRYVRVLDELPKTPTSKVQKHLLREAGLTRDVWDREAAGIVVKRERVGQRV